MDLSFKKLLVLAEAGEGLERVVHSAQKLSERFELHIDVVHFCLNNDSPSFEGLFPKYREQLNVLKDVLQETLEAQYTELVKASPQTKTQLPKVRFVRVHSFEDLLKEVETLAPDLMLIQATNDDFDSSIRGSLAERLIRASQVPVLCVKETLELKSKRILLPFAFQGLSENSYRWAGCLAQAFGAQVELIHVHSEDFEAQPERLVNFARSEKEKENAQRLQPLHDFLEEKGLLSRLRFLHCQDSIKEYLLSYIQHEEPALVVMGSSQKSGLERLYLGSHSEFVLNNSPASVLITKT